MRFFDKAAYAFATDSISKRFHCLIFFFFSFSESYIDLVFTWLSNDLIRAFWIPYFNLKKIHQLQLDSVIKSFFLFSSFLHFVLMNFLIFDVSFQTSFWFKLFDPLVITAVDNKHCVKKDLKVWDKPQLSGMIKSFANDSIFLHF